MSQKPSSKISEQSAAKFKLFLIIRSFHAVQKYSSTDKNELNSEVSTFWQKIDFFGGVGVPSKRKHNYVDLQYGVRHL
jgi:hypothetical protein